MSDKVVLHPGHPGDPETGDGWMPEISLEHHGTRAELYVIVGEEAGGMIEGVSAEQFAQIAPRLFADDELKVLLAAVMGDHLDPDALDRAITKLDAVDGRS